MIETRRRLIPLIVGALASSLPVGGISAQQASVRPPAPTLQRPASPTRPPDANGFIQRWQ